MPGKNRASRQAKIEKRREEYKIKLGVSQAQENGTAAPSVANVDMNQLRVSSGGLCKRYKFYTLAFFSLS